MFRVRAAASIASISSCSYMYDLPRLSMHMPSTSAFVFPVFVRHGYHPIPCVLSFPRPCVLCLNRSLGSSRRPGGPASTAFDFHLKRSALGKPQYYTATVAAQQSCHVPVLTTSRCEFEPGVPCKDRKSGHQRSHWMDPSGKRFTRVRSRASRALIAGKYCLPVWTA